MLLVSDSVRLKRGGEDVVRDGGAAARSDHEVTAEPMTHPYSIDKISY